MNSAYRLTTDLQFDQVPEEFQKARLVKIATRIWSFEGVLAIWLAGSLAQGTSDAYSDIDLWVAVKTENLEAWRLPNFDTPFDRGEIVGRMFFPFGPETFVHSLMLSDGMIFDLGVQSEKSKLGVEPRLVLGCRDEAVGKQLVECTRDLEPGPFEDIKEKVEELITVFWIHSHKHIKVHHRELFLVSVFINRLERLMLSRMWYLLHTKEEIQPFPIAGMTVHGMTKIDRVLQKELPDRVQAVFIGPRVDSRKSLFNLIEATRDEVSEVGRALAVKFGFEYPEALENTVRRSWEEFRLKV